MNTSESAGRVAVVVGASRGIGLAVADALIARGDRVATLDRTAAPRDDRLAIACDVTDADAIDAAFSRVEADLGPVEIVVYCAGVTRDVLLPRLTDDDIDEVLDVNLTGALRVIRRVSRGMLTRRFGRIVLISSIVGAIGGVGQANYAASKAGLIGLGRSVARELGGRGVTCNVVAPGFIETDMTAGIPDDLRERYVAQIPAARFGRADEVAHAVAFLTSDQAAYINGAVLPVDGGMSMGI